ncbi:MAG: dockerin type I domain-containing protein [Phycisphaerales bacterium]|nr:dockerin type I domain-containing protein [Phycisphaerales bacterium]
MHGMKIPVVLGALLGLTGAPVAMADVLEDIGIDALMERLGSQSMPTGFGVRIAQVEADESGNYAPDEGNSHFIGKTFHIQSGDTGASGHATNICQWMCGNEWSPAPGVTDIDCWSLEDWCLEGFLRANFSSSFPPWSTPNFIKNFNLSWIASFGSVNNNHQVLRRADYVVERDNVMMCHGVGNTGQASIPLMTCMFNGLSVGKRSGAHLTEDTVAGIEGAGRMRPEIVAPLSTSSAATGLVSGVMTLLVETARNDDSLDSQAEDTEVIKALLLAGATHVQFEGPWANGAVTEGAERGTSIRPLNNTLGAGMLNADRSHRMLTSGRTWGGLSSSSPGAAELHGWDQAFCLATSSRWWSFSLDGRVENATIVATWNRIVNDEFTGYAMGNADLELWRLDADGELASLVGDAGLPFFEGGNVTSQSAVDNVELLSVDGLAAGDYVLELRHASSGVNSLTAGMAWYFSDPEVVDVPGDLDGDGQVGVNDLLMVIAQWNCTGNCTADADGDGTVNVSDLLIVIANWD